MKIIAACVIVIQVMACEVVGNEESIDVVPPRAIAVLCIDNPQLLGQSVGDLVSQLFELDEVKTLISEAIAESELEHLKEFILNGLDLLQDVKFCTFFVTDSGSFCIVCRYRERANNKFEAWISQCPEMLKSRLTIAKESKNSQISNVASSILSADFVSQEHHLVIASSKSLRNDVETRLRLLSQGQKLKDSMSLNRKFRRSYSRLSRQNSSFAFAYFNPEQIFPLLENRFQDSDILDANKIPEFVSCCIDMQFTVLESRQKAISVQCVMANTFPPSGLAAVWNSFEPIESIPRISEIMCITEPTRLLIKQQNLQEFHHRNRVIHEEIHGSGAYEDKLSGQFDDFGGPEIALNKDSGLTVGCWFKNEHGANESLKLFGVGDREDAEIYRRKIAEYLNAEDDNRFPITEYEVDGGYKCWFLSGSVAKRKFMADFKLKKLGDRWVDNHGSVVGPKWTMVGNESTITRLIRTEFEDLMSVDEQLNAVLQNGFPDFISELKPGWMEINWTTGRLSHFDTLRYNYLREKYPRDAFKMFSKSREHDHPHVGPKDEQDTVFAFTEILGSFILNKIEYDILAFASEKEYVQWRWIAVPVVNNE